MNRHESIHPKADRRHGDDALEPLFRHAGVRPRPPGDVTEAVRESLHGEWRAMTARNRRRIFAAWGLAASVVLALVLVFLPQRNVAVPGVALATVASLEGELLVRPLDAPRNDTLPLSGTSLYARQVLITDAESRAGFTWTSGESVRLDHRTEVALLSNELLELRNGTVYVDSGGTDGDGLVIRTPAGDVRHIGTQYMADVNDGMLTVSVREGRVSVLDEMAVQGERLTVNQRGQVRREPVEPYGPLWHWTELLTPRITLDGMSAEAFVRWAARQTGRELGFADDQTRNTAATTMLRGTIEMEPARALELILQTTDLEYEIDGGAILVRTRPGT